MTERTRGLLYRLAVVIIAIAVLRGLITNEEAGLWVELVVVVCGLGSAGLAAKHTTVKRPKG